MARRAWLLFTPQMALDLYELVHNRELWVCENELPNLGDGQPNFTVVAQKAARNGATYYLLESPEFEDVPASDYPLLPQPRLLKRSEWLADVTAKERTH